MKLLQGFLHFVNWKSRFWVFRVKFKRNCFVKISPNFKWFLLFHFKRCEKYKKKYFFIFRQSIVMILKKISIIITILSIAVAPIIGKNTFTDKQQKTRLIIHVKFYTYLTASALNSLAEQRTSTSDCVLKIDVNRAAQNII